MSCCGHRISIVHAVAGLYLCAAVVHGAGADNRADYVYKAIATGNDNGLVTVRIVEPKNTSLCNVGDYAYMYGVPVQYREFTVKAILNNNQITLVSAEKGFQLNVENTDVWLVTWTDVGRRWLKKLESKKGEAVEEVLREAAEFRDPRSGRYKDNAYRLTRREIDAVWSSVPLNDKLIENYKKAFDRNPPTVTGTLVVNNTGEVPLKVEIGGQTQDVKPHQSVDLSVTAGVKHSVKYEPTGKNADDFNAGKTEVMVPIEGKMATVSLAAAKKGDPVLKVRNTGDVALRVTVLVDGKAVGGAFELAKGASREVSVLPNVPLKISYEPTGTMADDYRDGAENQVPLSRGATASQDLTAKLKSDPVLTLRNAGEVALRVTVLADGKAVGGAFELAKGASREVPVLPNVPLNISYEPTGNMADDYRNGEEAQTALGRGTTGEKVLAAKLKSEPVLTVRNTGEVALKVTVQADGKPVGPPFDLVKGESKGVTVLPNVALKVVYEPTGTLADDYLKGDEVHTELKRGATVAKNLAAKLKPDPVLTVRNAGDVALKVTVLADGKAVGGAFELAKGAFREVPVLPNAALRAVYEPTGTLADDYNKGEEAQTALKRGATATKDLQAKLKSDPALTVRNAGEVALRVTVQADGKAVGEAFELAKGGAREVSVPPNVALRAVYEPTGTLADDYLKGGEVQAALKRGATDEKVLAAKIKADPVLKLYNKSEVALRVTVQAGGKDVGQPFNLVKGASQEVTVPPRVALKVGYEPTGTMADDYLKGEEVHTIQRRGVTETKDLQAKLKPDPVLTLRNTGEVALKVTVQAGGKAVGGALDLAKGASREVSVPPNVPLSISYEPTGEGRDAFEAGQELAAALERGTQGAVSLSANKSLAGRLQVVRDILKIELMKDVPLPEASISSDEAAWEALAVSKKWFDDFINTTEKLPRNLSEQTVISLSGFIRLANKSLIQLRKQAHRIRAARHMAQLPPVDKTPDDLKEWRKWAEGFLKVLDGGEAEFSEDAQVVFVLVQRGLRVLNDNSLAGVATFGEFIRGKGDDGKKGK